MSGPAIHHILARQTVRHMKKGASGSHLSFLEKVETEWSPYLLFGCQGPDPLFFNTKDMNPKLREFVKMYVDVLEFMEDFKEKIKEIIPPEVLAAADALQAAWDNVEERSVLLSEIEQGLTDAKHLLELLKETIIGGVKKYITDAVNVYDTLLSHPIQDKGMYNPGTWWWFDTLHYRKSGEYAFQLLKNAKPDSEQMAYALGYLTHFSADTTGHPFVNIISGGPYRTHGQRHKFVENHQDVYAWKRVFSDQEFVQSKAGDEYIIGGDAGELPADFNQYIRKTISDVYGSLNYGKTMDAEDLDDTYRLWLRWFRSTTDTLSLPKPVPYSLTKEMEEAWEKFKENMGDTIDGISSPGKGGGNIWDFFKSLAAAILGSIAAAIALVDFLLGVIATLGAAPIRYLISLAYAELYNAFMQFHQGLVMNGLAFPFNAQLDHYAAKHTVHSGIKDTTGIDASMIASFLPMKKFKVPTAGLESHLVYPRPKTADDSDPMLEHSRSTVAPDSYFDADAFHYMWGDLDVDPQFYEYIKKFTELSGSQFTSEEKEFNFTHFRRRAGAGGLGSAVNFGAFLFDEFKKGIPFPDLNLDGDRGYAFPCWRRVKSDDMNKPAVMHVAVETAAAFGDHNVMNAETDIIHPNKDIL